MGVYISKLDIETYRGIKKLKMENLAPIRKYIPVDFGDVQKIECTGICYIAQ